MAAVACGTGEKSFHLYDWTYACVTVLRRGPPGSEVWLVARRSLGQPTKVACCLAPRETSLLTLAQVASSRYAIEQLFEEAKGETGLDEYEVRDWHSWHRHITLSMMAHTWLVSILMKSE